MKTAKMSGIFCRSPAATAVCLAGDHLSVFQPGRPARMVDHSKLLDLKYSRLVESRRFSNQPSLPEKQRRVRSEKKQPNRPEKPNLPILSTSDCAFQVVVMRVSLHCQGCAGKVKKHISKMEGVTSFSIDLESKRVTVMGHVSRVEVLESISKVKKAEFWPAAASDLC